MSRDTFEVGDVVRTRLALDRDGYNRVHGKILEIDTINGTAVVKGARNPIPLAELELVPQIDPTIRLPDGRAI